jgi:hypothetical protein
VTDQTLNEKMMSEALDAIREEAERLLNYDSLSEAARRRLELVLSITRHGFDVRTDEEKAIE